jgi:hypothetical protein
MLPQVIQAIGSMAMGEYGRESLRVGENVFPVEAFPHMLKMLAEATIDEYQAQRHAARERGFDAFLGQNGESLADPANPEARARALYEALQRNFMFPQEDAAEYADPYQEYADPYQEALASWETMWADPYADTYDENWGY